MRRVGSCPPARRRYCTPGCYNRDAVQVSETESATDRERVASLPESLLVAVDGLRPPADNDIAGILRRMQPRCQRYRGGSRRRVRRVVRRVRPEVCEEGLLHRHGVTDELQRAVADLRPAALVLFGLATTCARNGKVSILRLVPCARDLMRLAERLDPVAAVVHLVEHDRREAVRSGAFETAGEGMAGGPR